MLDAHAGEGCVRQKGGGAMNPGPRPVTESVWPSGSCSLSLSLTFHISKTISWGPSSCGRRMFKKVLWALSPVLETTQK